MVKLDKYEKELVESIERGEWKSVDNLDEEKKRFARYARNTYKKNKRINIRISEWDLIRLKAKSLKEGIPYQTLVSSLIHKFVTGDLIEQH